MRVLVVDDEPDVRALVSTALGYAPMPVEVIEAGDGEQALILARAATPDIVVLDLALPGRDGFSVLEELRRESTLPIIVLTARGLEHDKIHGLELGADDYMVKPFSLVVLAAHLRSVLRRRAPKPQTLREADIEVDTASRRVRRGHREIPLTSTEYRLLLQLMREAGSVIPKRELTERVWGYGFGGNVNVLEVYVGYLRDKLEAGGESRVIHTIRGQGYTLRPDP
jgi:two-component system, OmpR family, response regulator MprA